MGKTQMVFKALQQSLVEITLQPDMIGILHSQQSQKALEVSAKLRERLNSNGDIKREGDSACSELVALIQELQSYLLACGRAAKQPKTAKETLHAGRAAVLRRYDEGMCRWRAREWLQLHNLGHYAVILEDAGHLHRLVDFASQPLTAAALCVPERCHKILAGACADGRLVAEDLAPGPLPKGWEMKKSSSTSLRYFTFAGSNATQWHWPLPSEEQRQPARCERFDPPELSEYRVPEGNGSTTSSGYIVNTGDAKSNKCLLCGEFVQAGHLQSQGHAMAVSRWQELAQKHDALSTEIRRGLNPKAVTTNRRGLEEVWTGEVRTAVLGQGGKHSRIEATFWHRVVKPRLRSLGASLEPA
jgi:hypothetical protein